MIKYDNDKSASPIPGHNLALTVPGHHCAINPTESLCRPNKVPLFLVKNLDTTWRRHRLNLYLLWYSGQTFGIIRKNKKSQLHIKNDSAFLDMKSGFENLYFSAISLLISILWFPENSETKIVGTAGEMFQSSRGRLTWMAAAGWRQVSSGKLHRQEDGLSLTSCPLDVSLDNPASALQLSDEELPGSWRPL